MSPTSNSAVRPVSKPLWATGVVLLAFCVAASGMLTLHHFGALSLPGCGMGSPCDSAAKSAFGSIPGLGWPVSFVGFAYFAGLFAAWLSGRGKWSNGLRVVVYLGALASVAYTIIAFSLRVPCSYCLVIHACNLAFAAVMRQTLKHAGARTGWQSAIATAVGLAVMTSLVIANGAASTRAKDKAEADLAASMNQIAQATGPATSNPDPTPASPTPASIPDPQAATTPDTVPPIAETPPAAAPPKPLTGRYRWGPEAASVRIVMFTDYQCPDCKKIESELEALMRDTSLNLSFSARHFPLSTNCNPNAPGNRHGNACWAARAAEAAGQMGGADAFYEMHKWLFSRSGSFDDAAMDAQAAAMGFDPQLFGRIMQGPTTLEPVKEDIAHAMSLGIFQTPFIFINGVELRGWNAPQALTRAVRAAAAAAPATAINDVPPSAADKLVEDWRQMPLVTIPDSIKKNTMGPADAEVEVVMWGDYQEKFSAEADGLLRLFTKGPKPNIRYTFLQFPVDKTCNPVTQVTAQPLACRAAKAAKAAEALAGEEGFWLMHDRLMMNQQGLTDAVLEGVAMELGLQPSDLFEAMEQPFVTEAIVADARAAQQFRVQSIPMLFIGGRLVSRWKADNENILPKLIEAAARQ